MTIRKTALPLLPSVIALRCGCKGPEASLQDYRYGMDALPTLPTIRYTITGGRGRAAPVHIATQ